MLEGYRWIFSILRSGFDTFVWADTARPRFVDIVGPYKKWGGDNADAFYHVRADRPWRTYRVTGTAATPCTSRSRCTADPTTGGTPSASSAR